MTHVRNGRFYGLLALAGLVWGLQPLFVKFVVAELTPTTLTALRYSCITLLLFVLAVLRGIPLLPRRDCLLLLVFMGLTGVAFNNIAQFSGLQYSSVGNATLIGAPRRLPRRCSRPSSCGKSFCPSSGWASASRCWGRSFW